jgi:hypothetical protein
MDDRLNTNATFISFIVINSPYSSTPGREGLAVFSTDLSIGGESKISRKSF